MKIVTYVAAHLSAPEGESYIARIRTLVPGKKKKLVEGWHPVVFTGASAEAVEAKAQGWWDRQLEAERNRQAGIAKAAAARALKAASQ